MMINADGMAAQKKERLWIRLQEAALKEVEAVREQLPAPLRARALNIPVSFDRRPGRALADDGEEEDLLGLYVGESYSDEAAGVENVPAQILLFLQNIWDYANHDMAAYREEVRVTYLHELGHYLGLDEEDMIVRDLD